MRIKAHALGIAAEDYFNDKVLEDTDLLYTGDARAARGFLGQARQGRWNPGSRAAAPTIACTARCAPACWSTSSSTRRRRPGETPFYAMVKEVAGKTAVLQTLKDYTHQQEQRLGHHRAQPRAEFRAQPADESRGRLRHAARPGRHRQDAAHAGGRADADARVQGLLRDHHDARHGAGGRGHRLPARHRGREDDAVDGRAGGQPRRAQQDRRRGRRMGTRGDARPDPLAHQGESRSTSCAAAPSSTSS